MDPIPPIATPNNNNYNSTATPRGRASSGDHAGMSGGYVTLLLLLGIAVGLVASVWVWKCGRDFFEARHERRETQLLDAFVWARGDRYDGASGQRLVGLDSLDSEVGRPARLLCGEETRGRSANVVRCERDRWTEQAVVGAGAGVEERGRRCEREAERAGGEEFVIVRNGRYVKVASVDITAA